MLKQANHYYNLGLNITHISRGRTEFHNTIQTIEKSPSHSCKEILTDRQDQNTLQGFNWKIASGVGTILGFNNLRALDIDGCDDLNIINDFLQILNLPLDYPWVTISGSKKGFHIIFYCLAKDFTSTFIAFKPNNKNQDKFHHIEVKWKGHLVLPPSLHPSSQHYEFRNSVLPQTEPSTIELLLVENLITKYCSNRKTQEEIDGYLEKKRAEMEESGEYSYDRIFEEQIHSDMIDEYEMAVDSECCYNPKSFDEKNCSCAQNVEFEELLRINNDEGILRLLKKGFDISRMHRIEGYTPLEIAVRLNNLRLTEILFEYGANPNEKDGDEWPLFFTVCIYNTIDFVKLFIKNNVQINIEHKWGGQAIHWAVRKNKPQIIELLIQAGADVNAPAYNNYSPLHYAVEDNDFSLVKLLIKNGANINILNRFDRSPIFLVIGNENIEILKFFIDNNADVNRRAWWRWTPLHVAASRGNLEIVKILVENNAESNVCNSESKTPLDLAIESNHTEVAQYLKSID